jgi:hypothetical protein
MLLGLSLLLIPLLVAEKLLEIKDAGPTSRPRRAAVLLMLLARSRQEEEIMVNCQP